MVVVLGTVLIDAAPASAARRVSASYGVLGRHALHATATTSGVPGGERIVLDGRLGGRPTAVRSRSVVRHGTAALRWTFHGRGALHVRVRVLRGSGSRARTLAASGWRTLQTGSLHTGRPLARVAARDVLAAPAPGRSGDLVLRGRGRARAGDAVALASGRRTPDGLLVRVRSVRRSGGTTTLGVTPTTLPDVMPVGDLELAAPAGRPGSLGGPGAARVARPFPCDGGFASTIAARSAVAGGLRVRAAWRSSGSLERPNVTADLRADVRAALDVGVSLSGASSCTLTDTPMYAGPVLLRRVSTSIGPLPVTATLDGQLRLSGAATTLGRIATAARGDVRASVRSRYDGFEARTTGTLSSRLRPHDTEVGASGGAQVGVRADVGLRLFGLTGPRLDATSGVRTTADVATRAGSPWWRTTTPDELGGSFALEALRPDLDDPRAKLAGSSREIDRARSAPGGSAVTGPVAGDPLPDGVRARVSWDSTASVDLHAFDGQGHDLSARSPSAIPGARIGFIADADGPLGTELRDSDGSRPLAIGLCQSDGTESAAVVDVRRRDGATDRWRVVLRGLQAGAVVTTTPDGSPAVGAPAGWCGRPGGDPSRAGEATTGDLSGARPRALVRAFGGRGAAFAPVRHPSPVTSGTEERP